MGTKTTVRFQRTQAPASFTQQEILLRHRAVHTGWFSPRPTRPQGFRSLALQTTSQLDYLVYYTHIYTYTHAPRDQHPPYTAMATDRENSIELLALGRRVRGIRSAAIPADVIKERRVAEQIPAAGAYPSREQRHRVRDDMLPPRTTCGLDTRVQYIST